MRGGEGDLVEALGAQRDFAVAGRGTDHGRRRRAALRHEQRDDGERDQPDADRRERGEQVAAADLGLRGTPLAGRAQQLVDTGVEHEQAGGDGDQPQRGQRREDDRQADDGERGSPRHAPDGVPRRARGHLPAVPQRREQVRQRRARGDRGGDDHRERRHEQQQTAEVSEERVPHRARGAALDLAVARQPLDRHPPAGQQQDRRDGQSGDREAQDLDRAAPLRGQRDARGGRHQRRDDEHEREHPQAMSGLRRRLGHAVDQRHLQRDVGLDAIDAVDRQVHERRLHEHADVPQVEPQPRVVARQQRRVHAADAVLEQREEGRRAGDARDRRLDQRPGRDEVGHLAQHDAVGDLAAQDGPDVGIGERSGRAVGEVPLREQLVAGVAGDDGRHDQHAPRRRAGHARSRRARSCGDSRHGS